METRYVVWNDAYSAYLKHEGGGITGDVGKAVRFEFMSVAALKALSLPGGGWSVKTIQVNHRGEVVG